MLKVKRLILLTLSPENAFLKENFYISVARHINVDVNRINHIRLLKRSIDARKKRIVVYVEAEVFIDEFTVDKRVEDLSLQNVSSRPEIIIIGCGPAGMFAALRLIELGLKPVIIERGKPVEERIDDINLLYTSRLLMIDSNFCYGEGGAGTFSDGKLFTRSRKRGDHKKVLDIFYQHGADESVLYESHPHVGSDKLPVIVKNIRNTILSCGGKIIFSEKIKDFVIRNNKIQSIVTDKGHVFNGLAYILATGHSAKDIYYALFSKNIYVESKPFAAGVRIEHPQQLINDIQYHGQRISCLPPAYYNVVEQVDGRGVYSFCMCPGGEVIPSMTDKGEFLVNGMSNSQRNSSFANSGFVVQIKPEDYLKYDSNIGSLFLQEELEKTAFKYSQDGFKAPAQRVTDFIGGRFSSTLPASSYKLGLCSSPLHEWLPEFISNSLKKALLRVNKKMKGFVTSDAILIGVESRTSSAIRIVRNPDSGEHVQINNLFPCGEGSGYSGGIVSSAVD